MKQLSVLREKYELHFKQKACGVTLSGGRFGDINLAPTSLFQLTLRNLENGEETTLCADESWEGILVTEEKDYLCFSFSKPQNGAELAVSVTLRLSDFGVHFDTEISNLDGRYSVLEVTYPIPQIANDVFDLFVTSGPGRLLRDLRHRDYKYKRYYPSAHSCMQYMAMFVGDSALYVGHHDKEARTKQYRIFSQEGACSFEVAYPAENLGLGANSFSLRGGVNWEYIKGDWYDVALRYAAFARTADWIPTINENGRPETPQYFKELPFWIMDFLPNIPEQGNNMPESLRYALKDDKDAWWREAIRIKETLGVPVGYHVYNWHKIAFNVDYPHFLPAKDDFKAGIEKLQAKGITVAPYINASSWESRDFAPSPEESFAMTGIKCAAKDRDGHIVGVTYPQIKPDGNKVNLVAICPTTPTWQRIMARLSDRMVKELGINGIYYDQSAAEPALPCTDPTHNHAPGNSGVWIDGIRRMMHRIRTEKPVENFTFTECNAEPYMNAFDGFLTWHWGEEGEVPAFPAVYSKYITMVGRVIRGKDKSDKFRTRFSFASSLLFGQQIGWCNCDVQDDPTVFPFLCKIVHLRYKLKELFISGTVLRPPLIKSDLPEHTSSPHLWSKVDIHMPATLAGAWQSADNKEIHIFLCNADDNEGHCTVSLRASEYGITDAVPAVLAPYAPILDKKTDMLTLSVTLSGCDVMHLTLK